MSFSRHPSLRQVGTLTSSHRGGNASDLADAAHYRGIDLLETDVWYYRGNVEVRHHNRIPYTPILWERWSLALAWPTPPPRLEDLLKQTRADALLFLDFKGNDLRLGPAALEIHRRLAPDHAMAICGRNYPQLDVIANEPDVIPFYSVGKEEEFSEAWSRLQTMQWPAISLSYRLATAERIDQLKSIGTTIICWTVNDQAVIDRLLALGVDGFTSDRTELLTALLEPETAEQEKS